MASGSGGSLAWQLESAANYDGYDRPTAAWDGNGNKTVTAYTMTNGVTTTAKVTNPLASPPPPPTTRCAGYR